MTGLPFQDPVIATENIADGVRQLVLQHFESSISMLKDPDISGPQLVHELRKNMKKVRAGLRLTRDAGQIDLAALEIECAEIGREFSRLRDCDVSIEMIRDMDGVPTGAHDSEAWIRFGELLADKRQSLLDGGLLGDESREGVVSRLDQVAHLLRALDLPTTDMASFERAAGVAQHKAGRALKKLRDDLCEKKFHRLRKRSKRELYQRRFLQSFTSTRESGRIDRLDLLCQELGQHQDLVVLIGLAESKGLLTDGLDQWLNALVVRRRAQIKALAAGLYV